MNGVDKRCTVLVLGRDKSSKLCEITALLWEKYWKNCCFEKVLCVNEYSDPYKLYDRVIHVPSDLLWGGRLEYSLNQIETEFVFLLAEDFFLQSEVDNEDIIEALEFAEAEGAGVIRLDRKPLKTFDYNDRWFVVPNGGVYTLVLQPAIYRTDYLKKIANKDLTPWAFERRSGDISNQVGKRIFCSIKNRYDYIHAWSNNSWDRNAIKLMKKNNIDPEYYMNDRLYPIHLLIKDKLFDILIHLVPNLVNRYASYMADRKTEKKLNF